MTQRIFKAISCAILIAFFAPNLVHAQDKILMFWLDDVGTYPDGDGAQSKRNFILKCAALEKQFPTAQLYPVITETSADGLQKVGDILSEDTKITHLIIATHGSYLAKTNSTSLEGLGGFSGDGPSEFFKGLLEYLGERQNFGTKLHIHLESCSNFRGTEADLKLRAGAVAKFTAQFGVKNFSMWGANRQLWSAEYSSASLWHRLTPNPVLKPLVVSSLIMFGASAAAPFLVLEPSPAVVWISALGLLYSSINLGVLALTIPAGLVLNLQVGTDGKLYQSRDGKVSIEEMDGLSQAAMRIPCANYL